MKERNPGWNGRVNGGMLLCTEMEEIVRGTRSDLSGNRAIGLDVPVEMLIGKLYL